MISKTSSYTQSLDSTRKKGKFLEVASRVFFAQSLTGVRDRLLPAEFVADERTALHYEFHGFENVDIGGRVASDRDDVGVAARLDQSDFIGLADEVSGFDRGGLNGVDRFHAPLHHFGELFGVIAVRIDSGVCAEGHPGDSGLPGVAKIFTLKAADLLLFFDRFGKHAGLGAFLKDKVIVIDVEHQIGAVLFRKGDAFVVDQTAVLDGIDARAYRVFDRLRAVSVRSYFAAQLMGFFGDGLHFFQRVLRRARLIAFA